MITDVRETQLCSTIFWPMFLSRNIWRTRYNTHFLNFRMNNRKSFFRPLVVLSFNNTHNEAFTQLWKLISYNNASVVFLLCFCFSLFVSRLKQMRKLFKRAKTKHLHSHLCNGHLRNWLSQVLYQQESFSDSEGSTLLLLKKKKKEIKLDPLSLELDLNAV